MSNKSTVKQLILNHSKARYLMVNIAAGGAARVEQKTSYGRLLASDARDQMVKHYA